MFDLVIKNAKIIDGTGRQAYCADVAIDGDRIVKVGNLGRVDAEEVFEAGGNVVCPGFVDIHSHGDLTIYRDDHIELLKPLVMQGMTTFVGGNCGMGMAPLGKRHFDKVRQYIEVFTARDLSKENLQWNSVGEYMDHLDKSDMLLNMGLLTPHSILRLDALGMSPQVAREKDLDYMEGVLDESMEAGSLGLSVGLQYFPGSKSDTYELLRLGRKVGKYGGTLAAHLRSYNETLPFAVDEIAEVAKRNGIKAQISHIMTIPKMNAVTRRAIVAAIKLYDKIPVTLPVDYEMKRIIKRVRSHEEDGIKISMDAMPTTVGFTHLLAFMPPWVLEGDTQTVLQRFADQSLRKKMYKSIKTGGNVWPHRDDDQYNMNYFKSLGFDGFRIMSVVSEENKSLEGLTLTEVGKKRHKHPFEAACDLLLEEDGHVLVFGTLTKPGARMTEESLYAALFDPETSISTDTILMGFGRPSELFHGCYPGYLQRYVRERKKISWESAIRKMTSLPASMMNLKDRGTVKEGSFADLVIFDQEKIGSDATFYNPEVAPEGIERVYINGSLVVNRGEYVPGKPAGRLLRRGKA